MPASCDHFLWRVEHKFYLSGSAGFILDEFTCHLDTHWHLVGTTLHKLILGAFDSGGFIAKDVEVRYFPYEVTDKMLGDPAVSCLFVEYDQVFCSRMVTCIIQIP